MPPYWPYPFLLDERASRFSTALLKKDDTLGSGNGAQPGGAYLSFRGSTFGPRLTGPFGRSAGAGFQLTRLSKPAGGGQASLCDVLFPIAADYYSIVP